MERYTLQERIEIIKIRYKNGENLAETVRKTRTFLAENIEENPGLSIPCRFLEYMTEIG